MLTREFETLAKLDAEENSSAKKHLIKELLGFSSGGDAAKMNEKEAADFASYLITEIDIKGKQLAGKPTTVA